MVKRVALAAAILATAVTGGFFVAALGAFNDEELPQ